MTIAATISIVILALLSTFQLALAAGAPLGKFAWGGGHQKLPKKLRISSFASIAIYIAIILLVLTKTSTLHIIPDDRIVEIGLWGITAYFMLGAVLNGMSRSRAERYTMTPIALILAICFVVIASN